MSEDSPKPSRRGTVGRTLERLIQAHAEGKLDNLPEAVNTCDECGYAIPVGDMGFLLQVTEITVDEAPHFPSAFDLDMPFKLFCTNECLRDFCVKDCQDKGIK